MKNKIIYTILGLFIIYMIARNKIPKIKEVEKDVKNKVSDEVDKIIPSISETSTDATYIHLDNPAALYEEKNGQIVRSQSYSQSRGWYDRTMGAGAYYKVLSEVGDFYKVGLTKNDNILYFKKSDVRPLYYFLPEIGEPFMVNNDTVLYKIVQKEGVMGTTRNVFTDSGEKASKNDIFEAGEIVNRYVKIKDTDYWIKIKFIEPVGIDY